MALTNAHRSDWKPLFTPQQLSGCHALGVEAFKLYHLCSLVIVAFCLPQAIWSCHCHWLRDGSGFVGVNLANDAPAPVSHTMRFVSYASGCS